MIDTNTVKLLRTAKKKLILLDYDGTLVGFTSRPDNALPGERLLAVLKKLIGMPNADVKIISGRMHQEIDGFLGHLPIEIIAEHGLMYKKSDEWKQQVHAETFWKDAIREILQELVDACPGSFIEEKRYSLAWHYRSVDPKLGAEYSRELISRLTQYRNLRLKVLDGNKVVEILTLDTSKGLAVENLIDLGFYDCILCIGDDKTDEDMFLVLADVPNAVTVKVGPGETIAKNRLEGVEDVLTLLEQLTI